MGERVETAIEKYVAEPKFNNLQEIHVLATQYMAKHGLFNSGWSFAWNTNKRRLAVCIYERGKIKNQIQLSIFHALACSKEEVIDSILHEIAHAIAGYNAGHGEEWKRIARMIGCKGNRCGGAMKIKGKWAINCPVCGKVFYRHRRPKNGKLYIHKIDKGLLTWDKWRNEHE